MSCSLCFQPLDKDEPRSLLWYVTAGCSVAVVKDPVFVCVCVLVTDPTQPISPLKTLLKLKRVYSVLSCLYFMEI